MDVRQLRYFHRIVAAGSISRAAGELRIAQPALSQHVANLERELGVVLLLRTKRGVAPTESGQRLLEHARNILSQIDRAIEDVSSFGRAPIGEVTVGLTAAAVGVIAAPLLARAKARYPGITLRILDGFSGPLIEWVRSGRADLALVFDIGEPAGVELEPALLEEVGLVGRDVAGGLVLRSELARVPLVLPSRGHATRQLAERYARTIGTELTIRYEVDALPALLALLRNGLGCSLLSQVTVRDELRRSDFGFRPIEPKLERMVMLARTQGRPVTRAVDAVRDLLCDVVGELVRSGTWPAKLLLRPRRERSLAQPEVEAIGF